MLKGIKQVIRENSFQIDTYATKFWREYYRKTIKRAQKKFKIEKTESDILTAHEKLNNKFISQKKEKEIVYLINILYKKHRRLYAKYKYFLALNDLSLR
jgi:hypothetical protein